VFADRLVAPGEHFPAALVIFPGITQAMDHFRAFL